MLAWEEGYMDDDEESFVELFQELIDTGIVWNLQGIYGRTALMLIERGHCEMRTLQ
jgi:hypothetical protein